MAFLPQYEVLALRYAVNDRQIAAHNFIDGDDHDRLMPLDYFMWVARSGDKVFLIDTGFDAEAAAMRGRRLLASPAERLHQAGLKAEEISDIIITHLHYDHAGNRDLFTNARFHIQDREMAYATGRCMCHTALRSAFDGRDVAAMVNRVFEGRVCFHDGTVTLAPGIELHRVGGHTDGLQVVRIWTRRGWMVIASDASHFYANMQEGRSFPIVYNLGDMYEGHQTCYRLADHPAAVIPGHDPLVTLRYPPLRPGLEGMVMRLDAEPL
ncbi:MAG: N-acyl homoserine lactonase family protein [Sphingobium sp.]|nr:N-acyl homoserine lactonase family protein [Sphingobium sp.]